MKILSTFLLIFIFSLAVFAQKPDEWKTMTIDKTNPEQAIEKFGKPKTDKKDDLLLSNPKWVTKKTKQKIWRVLHYETIEGFNDVKLYFDENDKLVVIQLEPKKITAQAFVGAYPDLEFRFADEVMSPADFKQPRNDEKTSELGAYYTLIGVTDQVFVFAGVGNAFGSVASSLFGGKTMRKASRSIAGDVKLIQLVSRTLENKDGADLLK